MQDPFKVLNIPYTITIPQLKQQFKALVLRFHPDRGGDPVIFDRFHRAYKQILQFKILEQQHYNTMNRTYNGLVKDRSELNLFPNIQNPNYSPDTFNQVFEEEKKNVHDPYAVGRGEFMKQDNSKNYMQVAIVDEPEWMTSGIVSNARELGKDQVSDFSSYQMRPGDPVQCSDLVHAYTQQECHTKMRNCRKASRLSSSADVTRYSRQRQSITSQQKTPQQLQQEQLRKQKLQEQEMKRRYLMFQETQRTPSYKLLQHMNQY